MCNDELKRKRAKIDSLNYQLSLSNQRAEQKSKEAQQWKRRCEISMKKSLKFGNRFLISWREPSR